MALSKPILTDQLSKRGCVPAHYIRPVSDRPTLLHVDPSDPSIPLIDFEGFNGPDRPKVVEAIGLACKTDGFFQVLQFIFNAQCLACLCLILPFSSQLPT